MGDIIDLYEMIKDLEQRVELLEGNQEESEEFEEELGNNTDISI